ncbi:nitroreductase family deazaflavin-dependent oxidoreductase [Mycobacterium arosiense]|uniref:Nitroreductase n=1 Tax=Mycobacterium arosiense ATCC BAA-1401 = DSM 45069 TaxID=1265311 RepID=A0A1W9Z6S0_MYCAI|nr:nitroreductase family deazaflavin-dependent oxidoreductase [Mycobacterium arosiense]ORA08036.1 nitroreductase [Mycobacterium arosiense ATCC BAA-1401 = DSM 45069]
MKVRSFDDANAFHRAIRSFAATNAGRVLFGSSAPRLERLIRRLTGGKLSFAEVASGLPTLILTTTGAKSGKQRAVAVCGIPHPDGVAVIATNYGAAKHPGWYHNLKANPTATMMLDGNTWRVTARLAAPNERDRIWARGVELYPGYEKEQMWAGDRHFEAFVLTRTSGP